MANKEHLTKLLEGVEIWNEWRKLHSQTSHNKYFYADLVSAELSGAQLSGAKLNRASLSSSDLSDSDLTKANLTGTLLNDVNLTSANLSGADLSNANLNNANLMDANLAEANLTNARLVGTRFSSRESLKTLHRELTRHQLDGCIFDDESEKADADLLEIEEADTEPKENAQPHLDRQPDSRTPDPVLIRKQIRQNLPYVRPALRLTATVALGQVSKFRETVRTDYRLRVEHEGFHAKLLSTLDKFVSSIDSLLDELSKSDGPATETEADETASWLEEFVFSSAAELSTLAAASAVAKVAIPSTVIFGVAAIGATIGPIAGFTRISGYDAGNLVGRLALGYAKPDALTAKVRSRLEAVE